MAAARPDITRRSNPSRRAVGQPFPCAAGIRRHALATNRGRCVRVCLLFGRLLSVRIEPQNEPIHHVLPSVHKFQGPLRADSFIESMGDSVPSIHKKTQIPI
jgi:hypothetical protein